MDVMRLADAVADTGKRFQGDFSVPEISMRRQQMTGRQTNCPLPFFVPGGLCVRRSS